MFDYELVGAAKCYGLLMHDSSFRGPVFKNVTLEWPKTPVLFGRKAETEDKTPSSETGVTW